MITLKMHTLPYFQYTTSENTSALASVMSNTRGASGDAYESSGSWIKTLEGVIYGRGE